jgi:dihydromonapterin reductase/dihydrofolate reductase
MPHLVITGASRRLGLFLTDHYLKQGWTVAAITRSTSDELNNLACEQLSVIETDYDDLDALSTTVQAIAESPVDLLVHNASYFSKDETQPDAKATQLNKMFRVHVQLPMLLNTLLLPALRQSPNANIVHMSDIYTENPNETFSNYCATKAALHNLSQSYAKQYAPDIRVNSIQPGALAFLPDHSKEAKTAVLEKSLLQRESGFEPVAQTIDYFINNHFLTGISVKVDGGRALCR